MKTPREILFKQHQPIEPKLDRLWTEKLSTQLSSKTALTRRNLPLDVLQTLWRELILPSRRIWAGVASAWILIFVLNFTTRDGSTVTTRRSSLSQEAIIELRQQEFFFAELMGIPEPKKGKPTESSIPGSRSERKREFLEA